MSAKDRMQFAMFIEDTLEAHPDWLDTAIQAVSTGMHMALERERQRCISYDLAFRSALALASKDRVTAETRAVLNSAIIKAIRPTSMCQTEKEFMARVARRENEERSDTMEAAE